MIASVALAAAAVGSSLELRLEGTVGPFDPGDTVTVGVWMTDLASPAAGFQAFLEYDVAQLTFISGGYTPVPFGLPVITPIAPAAGDLDLASGIDQPNGQVPSAADARLAVLTFVANEELCLPEISFRPTDPPTRLTTGSGQPILPLTLVAFPPPPCPSDLDGNGNVGFTDLVTLLAAWGLGCPGDIDQDGVVDFDDLIILLSDWGPC